MGGSIPPTTIYKNLQKGGDNMEKIFLIPTRWAKGKIPCAFSVECCKIDKRTMYYKMNRKYLINKNDLDKIMNDFNLSIENIYMVYIDSYENAMKIKNELLNYGWCV